MSFYTKESSFSRDVCQYLRSMGVFVQRIESGTTGKGIPDLYFASNVENGWIELKVARSRWDGTAYGIRWRTGQQAWLYRVGRMGVPTYTLVAYPDSFALITMDRIYKRFDRLAVVKRSSTIKGVFND